MSKLGDICTINMGQSPDSSTYNELENGIPFFQGNADFGSINPNVRVWCTNSIKVAKKGDILISVRAPIGALNISNCECCIGRGLAALTVNEQICESKFLWYALSNKVQELNSKGTGSTFKAISKQILYDLQIQIPTLCEQRKIVSILDKVTNLINLRKKEIEKLDLMVKSRFVEMFGMPNECRFELKTLPQIIKSNKNALKRGPFGGALKKDDFVDNGYLVYEQRHAIHNDFEYAKYYIPLEKYQEMIMFKVEPGDLLISCSGVTLGRIAEVPEGAKEGIINQALLKVTLNPDIMLNSYFITLFRNERTQDILFGFSRGSGIPNFPSMSEVKNIGFLCPPIKLQEEYDKFLKKVDKSKYAVKKSLEKLETLKKSLMQKYFD